MEMRRIVNNMDRLSGMDFFIVTNAGYPDLKDFSKEFQTEKYSNIHMGLDKDATFASYFMVSKVPFLAIYNKGKKLSGAYNGAMAIEQLIQTAGL